MMLRQSLIALVALFVVSSPALAEEELTPEKRADIERLFEMTGALSIGKQFGTTVAASMAQTLRKARPDIPVEVLDLLPAEVGAVFDENMESFRDEYIGIYHRFFSGPEIKEMIQFYSTDLGQKMIATMPQLMQEGFAAGQRWGQALAPQITERVTAKLKAMGIKL